MWFLGIELKSFGRAALTSGFWAISPAPNTPVSTLMVQRQILRSTEGCLLLSIFYFRHWIGSSACGSDLASLIFLYSPGWPWTFLAGPLHARIKNVCYYTGLRLGLFFFPSSFYFYLCVWLFASMCCLYAWYLWPQNRVSDPLELIAGESQSWCWEQNLGPLQERPGLLTADPSPQPKSQGLYFASNDKGVKNFIFTSKTMKTST